MRASDDRRRQVLVLILSAGALLLLSAGRAGAQGPNAVNSFPLYPGTIVDPARNVAYLMSDKGGIAKVDLATGHELWHSKDAAKPLVLGPAGQRLIGHVQPAPNANHLAVAVLNTADGRVFEKPDGSKMQTAIPLPPGVRPSIAETPSGQFSTVARFEDGKALVTWRSTGRPRRGVPPGVEEKLQPRAKGSTPEVPKAAQPATKSGAVLMDLTSGGVSPVNPAEGAVPGIAPAPEAAGTKWRAMEVTGDDRIPDFQGPQFYSADKRHVLVRSAPGPDANGLYKFLVYDRGTKQRVGQFSSHQAVMPFFVAGPLVVYQSTPAKLPSGSGVREQPAMIQAVDANGKEIWHYTIRDVHRESSPP
jgi:hypothetical protein